MNIRARVRSESGRHEAEVETAGARKNVGIPPKESGHGSSVNGGELLMLALATCYGNDVYREAARRGLSIESVEVDVSGEFGGEGEPARRIEYSARVSGASSEAELKELLLATDRVAEIQNTVRQGVGVQLTRLEVRSVGEAADQGRDPAGLSVRARHSRLQEIVLASTSSTAR